MDAHAAATVGPHFTLSTATVVRRLALWTVICSVSALPSFLVAHDGFHTGAMGAGVALFILLYTLTTCTPQFEAFHRRPFVRRTLYIGYGLRMLLSIAYPVGLMADVMPGLLSLTFVKEVLRLDPPTFTGTLVTTIIQGTLLNILIATFMAIVYAVQRMFCKPPEEPKSYGFEVVVATRESG